MCVWPGRAAYAAGPRLTVKPRRVARPPFQGSARGCEVRLALPPDIPLAGRRRGFCDSFHSGRHMDLHGRLVWTGGEMRVLLLIRCKPAVSATPSRKSLSLTVNSPVWSPRLGQRGARASWAGSVFVVTWSGPFFEEDGLHGSNVQEGRRASKIRTPASVRLAGGNAAGSQHPAAL